MNLRVNEHYQKRYKESLIKHHKFKVLPEEDTTQKIGELSLRPSVFVVLEQVLEVSCFLCHKFNADMGMKQSSGDLAL